MNRRPNAGAVVNILDIIEEFFDTAGAPLTNEQRKVLSSARSDCVAVVPS